MATLGLKQRARAADSEPKQPRNGNQLDAGLDMESPASLAYARACICKAQRWRPSSLPESTRPITTQGKTTAQAAA